jgi:hypothetical protein
MSDRDTFRIATEIDKQIPSTDEDSGFALPKGSLDFLREVVKQCGIRRIFEFGSGQSTRIFLESGADVYSLENDSRWLEETKNGLPPNLLDKWTSRFEPLQLILDGVSPFFSWKLDEITLEAIRNADLVLIDSPAHPPSREMPLIETLRSGCKGIIVVDDLRIPTLERRVQAIASGNSQIKYRLLAREHGLGLLHNQEPNRHTIKSNRSIAETIKIVRRYLSARRGV